MAHSIQGEGSSSMRVPPMVMIPGKESIAKDFAMRLLKISQVEYNLPEKYIEEICENFEALDCDSFPKGVLEERLPAYTKKFLIANNEFGMFKYLDGDGMVVRSIVKEVCIFLHLKELQGTKIPELLAYGVVDAEGAPGFFLLAEFCGDPLDPSQVTTTELGEILSAIHDRGISLGVWGFPYLMRCGSTLVLYDFTDASFEERKDKLQQEFSYLLSLCKKH